MATKFNLNRQPVSDDEINSHKDFDKLVKKFKEQSIEKARSDVSFLKNKKITYSSIIAGVTVICTVTYFTVLNNQSKKTTANEKTITTQHQHKTINTKTNNAFINPPIKKLSVPYNTYNVTVNKGGTIKHQSNSKITIPKNAFVNKKGEDIIGDVEIKYREFHNPADIIASGIPMTYDSAGVTSHFESAGMLDIKGYQNGEPVFIKQGKQITIEYESEYPKDKYNMYYLDTIAKNWTYLNRDNSLQNTTKQNNITSPPTESVKTKELKKELDAIPPKIEVEKTAYSSKLNQLAKIKEPSKPQKTNNLKTQFELDVDYKEFPELSAFKNAVFEVGDENKNFNPKLADITWSSAEISEGSIKGKNYLLTLKQRDRVEKLIVYPVLSGTNYENALKVYETKFNDYKKSVAKIESEKKRLQEEFEAKQAEYLKQEKLLSNELLKERLRIQREQDLQMSNNEKVRRIFLINKFGIYNSDCPHNLPKDIQFNASFVENNTLINPNVIYLISKNNNLIYSFTNSILSYNRNEEYILCLVTDNQLYHCNAELLKKYFDAKKQKIPVTKLNADINNISEFKKALDI